MTGKEMTLYFGPTNFHSAVHFVVYICYTNMNISFSYHSKKLTNNYVKRFCLFLNHTDKIYFYDSSWNFFVLFKLVHYTLSRLGAGDRCHRRDVLGRQTLQV